MVLPPALWAVADTSGTGRGRVPLTVFALVLVVGGGTVWLAGGTARAVGRLPAGRALSAATLIAAERLRADPWAAARTHAAVLLVTIVGTGFMGIRGTLLAVLHRMSRDQRLGADMAFYTTDLDLTAVAILVGLAITSLLLETALPPAPAVVLAGAGGMAIGVWYASLTQGRLTQAVPYTALLVPVGVYACCLLAAAASLPLLRRSAHPGELRYA
ncbi:hypothetical protein ACWCQS_09285 [Streptomyces sp. NPDC002076]